VIRQRRSQDVQTIKTGDSATDRQASATSEAISQLLTRPIARVAIKAVLEWGMNKLDHGIGEEPFGFHATTDEAGAIVTKAQDDNPFPGRQLWVRLDGVARCNAVVFIY
jgi:hypothetical protein